MATFHLALKPPSNLTRLVLLLALSVSLMIFDHRGEHLRQIRAALMVVMYPIQLMAGLPARAGEAISSVFRSRSELEQEVAALRAERLELLAKAQKLDALENDNERLRQMLGAASRVAYRAVAAELDGASAVPYSRKITISRGRRDDVHVGQTVIDAHGIMGQVTQVAPHLSRVTLITDPGHAIPVVVSRNGLRAFVFGTGEQDKLQVKFLTAGADIREGDLLVSSGLGGNFPPNYPVARVTKKGEADPNEAFMEIHAKPEAQLNHSKQVLLIWWKAHQADEAPSPVAAARGEKK